MCWANIAWIVKMSWIHRYNLSCMKHQYICAESIDVYHAMMVRNSLPDSEMLAGGASRCFSQWLSMSVWSACTCLTAETIWMTLLRPYYVESLLWVGFRVPGVMFIETFSESHSSTLCIWSVDAVKTLIRTSRLRRRLRRLNIQTLMFEHRTGMHSCAGPVRCTAPNVRMRKQNALIPGTDLLTYDRSGWPNVHLTECLSQVRQAELFSK